MNITSNAKINRISKRDRILAFAKNNTVIKLTDGEKLSVLIHDSIEGSGHWDDEEGIHLNMLKYNDIDVPQITEKYTDILLTYSDWRFFVLVPFERK